jgi:hypothetical protein
MTATEHATAADFANWEARAKAMTDAELFYAARDCRHAEAAMRGWNPIKEGFYSDQASTYGDELRRRSEKMRRARGGSR